MAELSGFSDAATLAPSLGPQSMRVPQTKADGKAQAGEIFEGIWDAVEADLSPNVQIEILKVNGVVFCRFKPLDPNGVDRTVANPGDRVVVDGARLVGMQNCAYAARWTRNEPLEWAATDAPPAAAIADDGHVTLAFPQPESANQPFTYTVKDDQGADVEIVGDPTVTAAPDAIVTLHLNVTRTEIDPAVGYVVHCDTQYQGVDADSALSSRVRIRDGAGDTNGDRAGTRYYEYSLNGDDWILSRSIPVPGWEPEDPPE